MDIQSEEQKIIELLEDALSYDDYEMRINFLIAGLISSESNKTSEQMINNRVLLDIIRKFCLNRNNDKDKHEFLSRSASRISEFMEYADRNN